MVTRKGFSSTNSVLHVFVWIMMISTSLNWNQFDGKIQILLIQKNWTELARLGKISTHNTDAFTSHMNHTSPKHCSKHTPRMESILPAHAYLVFVFMQITTQIFIAVTVKYFSCQFSICRESQIFYWNVKNLILIS